MATRRNRKTFRKSKKTFRKFRKGGANECERLPFSRLSYDDLHSNYQKYCMSSNPLKKMANKNCCNTLKTKFKNWYTDARDFDDQEKIREYDEQYNTINNIPEDDSYIPETFMRPSMVGGKRKSRKNKKIRGGVKGDCTERALHTELISNPEEYYGKLKDQYCNTFVDKNFKHKKCCNIIEKNITNLTS